jgi:hypothetical protein
MSKQTELLREEFIKKYQMLFEIHPGDLGIMADFFLSKRDEELAELEGWVKELKGVMDIEIRGGTEMVEKEELLSHIQSLRGLEAKGEKHGN